MYPKVSIITPTTHDRAELNKRCQSFGQYQDYPNIIEHLFDYAPMSIGAKCNRLIHIAEGEIIVRFDSDDYYTTDYVSKSVAWLLKHQAEITGLSSAYLHDTMNNQFLKWDYDPAGTAIKYVCEATLCFYRKIWEQRGFQNRSDGEGLYFLQFRNKFEPHPFIETFCATIHAKSTSSQNQTNIMYKVDGELPLKIINSCKI